MLVSTLIATASFDPDSDRSSALRFVQHVGRSSLAPTGTAHRRCFSLHHDAGSRAMDGVIELLGPCSADGQQDGTSSSSGSSIVFGSEGDQTTRGALLDMLLLGMTNETGAGRVRAADGHIVVCRLRTDSSVR